MGVNASSDMTNLSYEGISSMPTAAPTATAPPTKARMVGRSPSTNKARGMTVSGKQAKIACTTAEETWERAFGSKARDDGAQAHRNQQPRRTFLRCMAINLEGFFPSSQVQGGNHRPTRSRQRRFRWRRPQVETKPLRVATAPDCPKPPKIPAGCPATIHRGQRGFLRAPAQNHPSEITTARQTRWRQYAQPQPFDDPRHHRNGATADQKPRRGPGGGRRKKTDITQAKLRNTAEDKPG